MISEYEMMTDRPPQELEAAMLLRGTILNHYAAIEFGLDELLLRLNRKLPYADLGKRLPPVWEQKVALISDWARIEGPLSKHRADIEELFAVFSTYEEIRHMMAHGQLAKAEWREDGPYLRYFRVRVIKGEIMGGELEFSPPEILYTTRKLAELAQRASRFLHHICEDLDLPHLFDPEGGYRPDIDQYRPFFETGAALSKGRENHLADVPSNKQEGAD